MKGKSKIWLFVGLGVLLVGVSIALALILGKEGDGWTAGTRPPETGETVQLATEEGVTLQTLPPLDTEETESPRVELTETPVQAVTQPTGSRSEPTEAKPEPTESKPEPTESKTEPTESKTEPTEATAPPQTENPSLELPYKIPGTNLVLGRLDSYEGIFLEQGTDTHTDNVAMILLLNEGMEALEYAILTLTMENGTVLEFEPTCLPAGGKMVVQERSGKAFPGGEILRCMGETATLQEFPMSKDLVKVTENENSSITITNITDKTIPAVRVFYKLYMEGDDGFVGGITYMAKVTNLASGASTTVRPTHYLYGSCKVVMVRTYDTAD